MIRLGIDAMGNDKGSTPIIEGVAKYVVDYPDDEVMLVGREEEIYQHLRKLGLASNEHVKVINATQVLEMDEKVKDLLKKRDSSIMRLCEAVREKRVDAMVALGNTAAAVGASSIILKCITGVLRPGIAVPFPTVNKGICLICDMGANVAVNAVHLKDYAVMTSIYAEKVLKINNPRVGILNVGEEQGKGNNLIRDTYKILEKLKQDNIINFCGNAEGRDLFRGNFDVVVCDGFVGNVALKVSEELANTINVWLRELFYKNWWNKLLGLLTKPIFKELKKRTNYELYGGAPLLGLNGICIIGHGRSSDIAVYNALRVARESVIHDLTKLFTDEVAKTDIMETCNGGTL